MVKFKKIAALSCGAICLILSGYFAFKGKGEVYYGAALFGVLIFLAIASSMKKVAPHAHAIPPEISKPEEPIVLEKGFRDIFGDEVVRKVRPTDYKKYVRIFTLVSIVLILGLYPKLGNKNTQEWLTYFNLTALALAWLTYGSSKKD